MPDYDISPARVDGVLAHAATLDTDLNGSLEQAGSEPIAAALAGRLDTVRPDLLFLPDRTGAYLQGDQQMAANAQEYAWSARDPRGNIPAGQLPR